MEIGLKQVMIGGAALMVVGIAVFGFADMKVADYEDADGILSRALDGGERQNYQNWKFAEAAGMIASGIGAVLIGTAFLLSRTEFNT